MSNRHVFEPLLDENNRIRPNAAVMLFVNGIPDPNFVGVVGVIPAKITELALPPNEVDSPNIENKKYRGLESIKTLSPEEPDTGVYTTSGLGLAIPSSRFPKEWLSKD